MTHQRGTIQSLWQHTSTYKDGQFRQVSLPLNVYIFKLPQLFSFYLLPIAHYSSLFCWLIINISVGIILSIEGAQLNWQKGRERYWKSERYENGGGKGKDITRRGAKEVQRNQGHALYYRYFYWSSHLISHKNAYMLELVTEQWLMVILICREWDVWKAGNNWNILQHDGLFNDCVQHEKGDVCHSHQCLERDLQPVSLAGCLPLRCLLRPLQDLGLCILGLTHGTQFLPRLQYFFPGFFSCFFLSIYI